MNAAKSCIPLTWKHTASDDWAVAEEDLVLTSRQKGETYTHTWTLWNMFIYSEEGKALIEVTPNG